MTRKHCQQWSDVFPDVYVCIGNHDMLIYRKAKTYGIPKAFVRTFNEILELPESWKFGKNWVINNVLYTHGTGNNSMYPHATDVMHNRQSTVIGHFHSVAGIEYKASYKDLLFGMCVGCGVDPKHITQLYGIDYRRKPIVACGVVTAEGQPILEMMKK
jgi:hypothetical protein